MSPPFQQVTGQVGNAATFLVAALGEAAMGFPGNRDRNPLG